MHLPNTFSLYILQDRKDDCKALKNCHSSDHTDISTSKFCLRYSFWTSLHQYLTSLITFPWNENLAKENKSWTIWMWDLKQCLREKIIFWVSCLKYEREKAHSNLHHQNSFGFLSDIVDIAGRGFKTAFLCLGRGRRLSVGEMLESHSPKSEARIIFILVLNGRQRFKLQDCCLKNFLSFTIASSLNCLYLVSFWWFALRPSIRKLYVRERCCII